MSILRAFLFFIFLSGGSGAFAVSFCKTSGGINPCAQGLPPTGWVQCGHTANMVPIYCAAGGGPSSSSSSSSNNTRNVVAAIGVGAAFVGVMYYLFGTEQSSYYGGQVVLTKF